MTLKSIYAVLFVLSESTVILAINVQTKQSQHKINRNSLLSRIQQNKTVHSYTLVYKHINKMVVLFVTFLVKIYFTKIEENNTDELLVVYSLPDGAN